MKHHSLAAALVVVASMFRIVHAADADEAAFGLRWSQTESDLKNAGVIPPGAETVPAVGGAAKFYSVARLPQSFADTASCLLGFNMAGELAKIQCSGSNVQNDPYGTAMKSRYEEVKAIISKRFGKPKSYEHQDRLWDSRDEWWMSLKTGRGQWASFWKADVMTTVVSVHAASNSSGYYRIAVEHSQRWNAAHEGKRRKEEEQF
jgi:hypothetical protein